MAYIKSNGYSYIRLNKKCKPFELSEHRLNALINNSLRDVLSNDVHHRNNCKFDNTPENLQLISRREHTSFHKKENKNLFNPTIKIRKNKAKTCKQGFVWIAKPHTSKKRLSISSADLNKCIKKVKEFLKSEDNTYGYINYKIQIDMNKEIKLII